MKKQQIRLIALPCLILAGTLSFAIPLSAQETAADAEKTDVSASEEQTGEFVKKFFHVEYRRAAGERIEVVNPSFYISDSLSFTIKIPTNYFHKDLTHSYHFEAVDTGLNPQPIYRSPERDVIGLSFNDEFVTLRITEPLKGFVYKDKEGLTTTLDELPIKRMSNFTMYLRRNREDGSALRVTSGNLGSWKIDSAKKMYDQKKTEDVSDAVASAANALRMLYNEFDESAYNEMADFYKGKSGVTISQVLTDGGLSLQTEFETVDKGLTLDLIKANLKNGFALIANVSGKKDGDPVHTITLDSIVDGKVQYTDPSDGAFKYCLAELKSGKIKLEGEEDSDFRSFTITLVKNTDHWSLAKLKSSTEKPVDGEKTVEKSYLVQDRRNPSSVTIGKPSFYITDTFSIAARFNMDSFIKGFTYSYRLTFNDIGMNPQPVYRTPEKELEIKDFDDKHFVLRIDEPLKSFEYKAEDGTTINELPPVKRMSELVLQVISRREDGSIYKVEDFNNTGRWKISATNKMYDQKKTEDVSDAVASAANAMRMLFNEFDESAYNEMADFYKGKSGVTVAQVLTDGGLSLQTEFETVDKGLTLDLIKANLKKDYALIVNVSGKKDGDPVHTITVDSIVDGKLQYTDPSDGAFKYCLAELKSGKIKLEGEEDSDLRSFTITVVKNTDHWSLDKLTGKKTLKGFSGKYLLVQDRRNPSSVTIGKPSFYITDTFSIAAKLNMDNFIKGFTYSYRLTFNDVGLSPQPVYRTPEKELEIKDYDDKYFVLRIDEPLKSFEYKAEDGTTTNELPPVKRMSSIVLQVISRREDGSVYRIDDFNNGGRWAITEEKDSLPSK